MGTQVKHSPVLGRSSYARIALLPQGDRDARTVETFTTAGTVAAGATSITISETITQAMPAGQALLFDNGSGVESLAILSGSVASGSAIPVNALDESLASGMTASYPPELYDRTAADIEISGNFASVTTLNTGGNEDGLVTGKSSTFSLPGLYYHKNAGLHTAAKALEENKEVFVIIEHDTPSAEYSKGRTFSGAAVIESASIPSPADGFINQDLSGRFVGGYTETKPTVI